jgi:hypothetical protein
MKSFGKSEHGCCDHKTSRNITCCADMRKTFFGGEGGLVVCRWGELGLGRRRRNRGGEGRQSWHILTFTDGFTDGYSVGESVGDHVCDSDGNIDMSPLGFAISNPSVSPSVM